MIIDHAGDDNDNKKKINVQKRHQSFFLHRFINVSFRILFH